MADENTPIEPEFAPEPVNTRAIRMKSMWKGAMNGLKKGGLIGLAGGVVVAGGMLGTGLMITKTAVGAAAGACGALMMVPYVGAIAGLACGGAAITAAGTVASHVAANGLMGTALQIVGTTAAFSLPIIIGGAALGAVVGMAWGAIHGGADAENDIERAEQAAKVDAQRKVVAHLRQQHEKAQLEQMKMEFAQQGREMGLEPGYLPSPRTPAAHAPNNQMPDPSRTA